MLGCFGLWRPRINPHRRGAPSGGVPLGRSLRLLLGTVVFAREYHERHAPKTILALSVNIDGKVPEEETVVFAHGLPRGVNQAIRIGNHTIDGGSPYTEAVSKERLTWYGVNDVGRIDLRRSKVDVILAIASRPNRIGLFGPFGRQMSGQGNVQTSRRVAKP